MIREQLIGAIAALEKYGSDPVNRHVGLQKLRSQLAALPESEHPWTPRERRLRELIERGAALVEEALAPLWKKNNGFTDAEDELYTWKDAEVTAALTEAPPPDPRDEALEAAEKALNRIGCDCESCTNALAAIARAKGGK